MNCKRPWDAECYALQEEPRYTVVSVACVVTEVAGQCVAGWCVVRQFLKRLDERLENSVSDMNSPLIAIQEKTYAKILNVNEN